jgi:hypothetical protein
MAAFFDPFAGRAPHYDNAIKTNIKTISMVRPPRIEGAKAR